MLSELLNFEIAKHSAQPHVLNASIRQFGKSLGRKIAMRLISDKDRLEEFANSGAVLEFLAKDYWNYVFGKKEESTFTRRYADGVASFSDSNIELLSASCQTPEKTEEYLEKVFLLVKALFEGASNALGAEVEARIEKKGGDGGLGKWLITLSLL